MVHSPFRECWHGLVPTPRSLSHINFPISNHGHLCMGATPTLQQAIRLLWALCSILHEGEERGRSQEVPESPDVVKWSNESQSQTESQSRWLTTRLIDWGIPLSSSKSHHIHPILHLHGLFWAISPAKAFLWKCRFILSGCALPIPPTSLARTQAPILPITHDSSLTDCRPLQDMWCLEVAILPVVTRW